MFSSPARLAQPVPLISREHRRISPAALRQATLSRWSRVLEQCLSWLCASRNAAQQFGCSRSRSGHCAYTSNLSLLTLSVISPPSTIALRNAHSASVSRASLAHCASQEKGPGCHRGPDRRSKNFKASPVSILPPLCFSVEQIIDPDSERLDVTTAVGESVDDAGAGERYVKACIVQRQVVVLQFRRPVRRKCVFETGAH